MTLAVALVSAAIIVLEILQHQLLQFFTEHLLANLAIHSAILGIGVGGLVAHACPRHLASRGIVALPVAALVALWAGIVYLTARPFDATFGGALLALPFVAMSAGLALAYVTLSPHAVYAASLAGAAGGVALVGGLYERVGAEAFLVVVSLLLIGASESALTAIPRGDRPPRVRSWLHAVLGLFVALLAAGVQGRPVDLARWSVALADHGTTRIHELFCERLDRVDFSRWSLEGRVDIVAHAGRTHWTTCINGIPQDTITPARVQDPALDPRFPLPVDPDSDALVLGLSAEGVAKSVRALVRGRIVGVELNPAVVEAMRGRFLEASGRAYEGVDVHVMDGRSYIEACRETFGLITLMSTHPPLAPIGVPEFLFTAQAFDRTLSLLSGRGQINIEETVGRDDPQGALARLRILETLLGSLRRAGVAEPDRHVLLYRWSMYDRYTYLHIIARRAPIQEADLAAVRARITRLETIGGREVRVVHDPTRPGAGACAALGAFFRSYVSSPLPTDRMTHPLDDDRPYLFPVLRTMPQERTIVVQTLALAMPVALIPAAVALWLHPRRRAAAAGTLAGIALLGTAYLLVELHLVHRFHLFLGSYSTAFVVVLAGLFGTGCAGSRIASRLGPRSLALVAALLATTLVGSDLLSARLFPALQSRSLPLKIAVSLLVAAPTGVLMGIPFPLGLAAAKRAFSDAFAALAFAANGAFSVIGSVLHLLFSATMGMSTIPIAGGLVYAAALLLLAVAIPDAEGRA
jgi:hypothetical protein